MNNKVGAYIRLSHEDDDKDNESESIKNQKSIIFQYAKENNYNIDRIYIDDGYSGTNFDRPEFQKLIKDIENKEIDIVITKDMSRLGRDYIGTGNLIEKYFPEHNIRYIAITDNIDTFLDSTNNDIAPFKAIMNDMYAKDISKKIKSSLHAKMKEGKFVGCRPPYGYSKDPNNKNHLIVNKEQKEIVIRIYKMCLDGMTCFKIAKILTEEKIRVPSSYYNFKWKNNYNNYNIWHSKTIKDILTNQMYTGDLVQNKRNKINYKVKKIIANNPKNYIIAKSTHEPIISRELFNEVQRKLPKSVGRLDKKELHLLDGLLYCGECGHRISITSRRKIDNRCYTICNYYRTYIKNKVCTSHSNNYDILENKVLEFLRRSCLNNIDKKKIKDKVINSLINSTHFNKKKEIKILEKEINQINENLDTIYIDKLNKNITEEQYKRIKNKVEIDLKNKQKKYNELCNSLDDDFSEEKKNIFINKYVDKFLSLEKMPRELIINLIDKIEIFEGKRINIKLAYRSK